MLIKALLINSLTLKIMQGEGSVAVVIWTTTPWTLPANRAVSVHPEVEYTLVQCETEQGKERLIISF